MWKCARMSHFLSANMTTKYSLISLEHTHRKHMGKHSWTVMHMHSQRLRGTDTLSAMCTSTIAISTPPYFPCIFKSSSPRNVWVVSNTHCLSWVWLLRVILARFFAPPHQQSLKILPQMKIRHVYSRLVTTLFTPAARYSRHGCRHRDLCGWQIQ